MLCSACTPTAAHVHYSRFFNYLNNIIITFLITYELHRLEGNALSLCHTSEGDFPNLVQERHRSHCSVRPSHSSWLTRTSSESLVSCKSHHTHAEQIKAEHILIRHHSHLYSYGFFEWYPYPRRRWIMGGFWASSRKVRPLFYSVT